MGDKPWYLHHGKFAAIYILAFHLGQQQRSTTLASPVSDYVKRFRDIKNRCYSLVITERDLADLVLNGLKTHIRERLENYEFLNIKQVLQKALAQESRVKEAHKSSTYRPRMHMVDYNEGDSDDEV